MIQLQPLALPPLAAAQFLSISKRSLSRKIAAGKIIARKEGSRTLVDVEWLRTYYRACRSSDNTGVKRKGPAVSRGARREQLLLA